MAIKNIGYSYKKSFYHYLEHTRYRSSIDFLVHALASLASYSISKLNSNLISSSFSSSPLAYSGVVILILLMFYIIFYIQTRVYLRILLSIILLIYLTLIFCSQRPNPIFISRRNLSIIAKFRMLIS